MRLGLLILAATLCGLCGCGLTQPTTEIGLVGYRNVGFEKQIEFAGIWHPDTRELIVTSCKVTNDATAMFEAQLQERQMLYDLIGGLVREIVPLFNTFMQQAATPATQPAEPKLTDQILFELLARVKALEVK